MCGSTSGMGCANMACSAGQCQISNVYANGTICDIHNPNAIDDRCQVSSCSNGQCSNVVSNKPAGTVCLPTPTGYEDNGYFYIDGTCESDECCAHCDGAVVMRTSETGRHATHARLAVDAEKGQAAASPMAVPVTGLNPVLDYFIEISRVAPSGTICDIYNTNGIDERCQVSSCSNEECSNVVSNKPAGTVCLPPPQRIGSYYYVDGTCKSDECCSHCDGRGSRDENIRDGFSCNTCSTGSECGEGPSGCEPGGCVCHRTRCAFTYGT
eukprot:SM000020S06096  [mRNA]  locus=s20:1143484:1147958:+ [translate_table: standard]